MIHRRKQLSPFVDQAELINRMRVDQIHLRAGVRVVFASRDEEIAAELVDAWITRTIAELADKDASVDELEVVAREWRRRRAPFLSPEAADVIVVDH